MPPRKGDKTPHQQLEPFKWKPGESGNHKGRPPGSRNKFSEDFLRDFHDSWKILGKPALLAMAWTNPSEYVRAGVALVPKEVQTTVTKITITRMTDRELLEVLSREDVAAPEPGEETIQ